MPVSVTFFAPFFGAIFRRFLTCSKLKLVKLMEVQGNLQTMSVSPKSTAVLVGVPVLFVMCFLLLDLEWLQSHEASTHRDIAWAALENKLDIHINASTSLLKGLEEKLEKQHRETLARIDGHKLFAMANADIKRHEQVSNNSKASNQLSSAASPSTVIGRVDTDRVASTNQVTKPTLKPETKPETNPDRNPKPRPGPKP